MPPAESTGDNPAQAEMPFAVVDGEAVTELPQDLYIPPDALEVFLEAFEGPLDLLLYLIRRQNLDILDIPINEITMQYVEYIDLMQELQLDLVGEYLLMAAMLAEIKSRMLLPRAESDEENEDDPRAELVRRLLEYERYKNAADDISVLSRMERDTFQASAEPMERPVIEKLPDLQLNELLVAFKDVLVRAETLAHHHIQAEALSVRQRMSEVLEIIRATEFTAFSDLFEPAEGRMGVTVTFLSLLELLREGLIEVAQGDPYTTIHVRAANNVKAVPDSGFTSEFDGDSVDAESDQDEAENRPDTSNIH
ncbi:MAG: ScpA family protein [Gammaproteobacteria bacterium]|nr:ScpA family protein [Gammaproteobacteria bacterium]MDP6616077.1 ScpA family protein [Gammaproteobacteria bacterium]MDP6695320.1 ScpA family protein [Gammaproteobacteria bacterium]